MIFSQKLKLSFKDLSLRKIYEKTFSFILFSVKNYKNKYCTSNISKKNCPMSLMFTFKTMN